MVGAPARSVSDSGSTQRVDNRRKYPRTPYWPWSPSLGDRTDRVHVDPNRFVGQEIVVTEKLDGSNVMLQNARVYGRSVAFESQNGWMAMVRKHHAWKVRDHVSLYGEDIFGVHSIAYDPVPEDRTFYAFGLRGYNGTFQSWDVLERYCEERDIPVVPVLFRGKLHKLEYLKRLIAQEQQKGSVLGGAREGVVVRLACGFRSAQFPWSLCKSVRPNHVQTDEHWTRNWKPCALKS